MSALNLRKARHGLNIPYRKFIFMIWKIIRLAGIWTQDHLSPSPQADALPNELSYFGSFGKILKNNQTSDLWKLKLGIFLN